jgi:hypothetical protein
VREDEVETGVAVPAVPDGEAVEADEPLEPADPREQHDLEQGRVRSEEAGEPPDAGEQLTGAVHVRDVATVHPQPDDQGGVAAADRPEGSRGEETA